MIYLQNFLLYGALLSAIFAVFMFVWIIRTRPSRRVPAYRRAAPHPVTGAYPAAVPLVAQAVPVRHSVDGRRRDW